MATRIGSGAGKANFSLTATCAPGSTLYLYAPAFVGQYQVNGEWVTALSEIAARPGVYTGLPLRQVGSVPRTGQVQVEFRVSSVGRLPSSSLGCLRPGALAAALARLQGGAPMRVSVSGHGFRAAVSAAPGARWLRRRPGYPVGSAQRTAGRLTRPPRSPAWWPCHSTALPPASPAPTGPRESGSASWPAACRYSAMPCS